MNRSIVCGMAAFLCLCAMANAEMRIWTSRKGDSVEAEYVKMYGSKVVLKTAAGKTLRVPAEGLCDDDREYLAQVAAVPPQLEIKVADKVDRDKNSLGYEETSSESVSIEITLRKKNPEPCLQRFKAYIYVLGRKEETWGYGPDAEYQMLEVKEYPVSFVDSDRVVLSLSVTTTYTEYDGGFSYEGYLLCIKDENGGVFAEESNQNILERNISLVLRCKKGDSFNEDFTKRN